MQGTEFDELAFFAAVEASGVRALLIHIDDIERFNSTAAPFGLRPTRSAAEARERGRYVLENDEHVDVLVARAVPTIDGQSVAFADVWSRRRPIALVDGVSVQLPAIADLILTKRFAPRPKDLEDIRLLEILQQEGDTP